MECFGKIYSAQISINWRHILFGGSLVLCIWENLLQDLSILVLFLKNRSLSTRRGSNTTKRKLSLAPSEKTVTWALLGKCQKQGNRRLKRNRRPGWIETDTPGLLLNFLTMFIWDKYNSSCWQIWDQFNKILPRWRRPRSTSCGRWQGRTRRTPASRSTSAGRWRGRPGWSHRSRLSTSSQVEQWSWSSLLVVPLQSSLLSFSQQYLQI